jgi:hypothetical protein
VRSGSLSFEIDGLDGAATIVASGAAPPVSLVEGQAVDATVTLAPGQHNGQPGVPCDTADTCVTGLCIDGVCCDTDCTGTCEACNVIGSEGTCSPIPDGTDPDHECPAQMLMLPDLGVDDAGNPITIDGGLIFPDGGLTLDQTQCAGACNGARACGFPGMTKSCGPAFCSEVAQVATFVCDGQGLCGQQLTSCADYSCASNSMCTVQCLSNTDCAPTSFCNVTTNKCVPRRDNGQMCTVGYECSSGFCVGNLCCNSGCSFPGGNCAVSGKEGQCQCSVACDPGVGCVLWYPDSDTDGHGDSAATIGNGQAKVGCESGTMNAPPIAGYVLSNDDCDDANINAHPGQLGFFPTARSNGSYDYDCNGLQETQFNLQDTNYTSNACLFCTKAGPFPSQCTTTPADCTSLSSVSRLYCTGLALCFGLTGNFTNNNSCGANTNFRQCGGCASVPGPATQTTSLQPMKCR